MNTLAGVLPHCSAWRKGVETEGEAVIRWRHTEHYLNMVLRAKPALLGPRQTEWMARFEIE